jgi:NADH-quinone oxidoreductase subunit H
MTTFLVLPFGPTVEVFGHTTPLVVIDSDVGILLFLALASLGVYSLVLAGWSSNNKWSLIGSIRASAQMISYELALTLTVVAVLIPAGSFYLSTVVDYQRDGLWQVVPQPLGFLVFLIAAFAETNRLPFDLPEAESELVAGYHTEYGSMRFAMFFMGEYMSMTTLSALGVTLYFGGWSLPFVDFSGFSGLVQALLGFGVIMAKVGLWLFFFVWVRWTFPRFRYDQLMRLGWKVLVPLALVQFVVTAALGVGGRALMELAIFAPLRLDGARFGGRRRRAPQPGLLDDEPGGDAAVDRRSLRAARLAVPRRLQVLLYTGAILVLFLFVIMLLNVGASDPCRAPSRRRRGSPASARWCSSAPSRVCCGRRTARRRTAADRRLRRTKALAEALFGDLPAAVRDHRPAAPRRGRRGQLGRPPAGRR